jgi:hypothetical protein
VDAWLDVLVAMLSVPRPDRQRVRDELEDHLRSRIDDLLIHGLTEPQALQKAVAELGETADLARQISHAHKPPRTRRYAMHALLIALTGTVVALGVNTMRPNAAAVPAVSTAHSEPVAAAHTFEDVLAIAVEVPVGGTATVQGLLQRFAGELGLPLAIDPDALLQLGIAPEHEVEFDAGHPATATLSGVLRRVQELSGHSTAHLGDGIQLTAAVLDSELVVTSRNSLDRLTTTRRVYPLARFADDPPDAPQARDAYEQLLLAVMEHVLPDHWHDRGGDLATATVLGSSLIVTAPGRTHEQIGGLLDELHAQKTEQAAQRAASIASQQAAAADQHQRLIARIKHEYELAVSEQVGLVQQIDHIESAYARAESKLFEENKGEQARNEMIQEMVRIRGEKKALEIRLQEATARVDYLLGRMIEIEYEPLVRTRDSNAARNPNVQPGVIEIRGAIARAGVYNYRLGQSLSRMLAAAGGLSDADSKVQLLRGGKVIQEWSAEEATSGPGSNATLLPGDTIAIVD